jgi:hypothetical protein
MPCFVEWRAGLHSAFARHEMIFRKPLIAHVLLLFCVAASAQDDADDMLIGVRNDAPLVAVHEPPTKRAKALLDYFPLKLNEAQMRAETLEVVKILANEKLTKEEREDLDLAITRDAERTAKAFGALLDWRRTTDVKIRLGAVKGLRVAYTAGAGQTLGASALTEPDADVRRAVINLIKERGDREAVKYLFALLLKSMESGEAVPTANQALNTGALAALRDIGDKQTFRTLLFYERIAMNVGITGATALDGIKIQAPNVDLPVDTPTHEIGFMQFGQTYPGLSALKIVTGVNFGHDLKKWEEWIDKQPDYKPQVK